LLGCASVILSDAAPNFVLEANEIIALNGLAASDGSATVEACHLAWGEFSPHTLDLKDRVDFIIGADVFYNSEGQSNRDRSTSRIVSLRVR
jgi:hypothetical protein